MKTFRRSLLSLAIMLAFLFVFIALDRNVGSSKEDYVVRKIDGQTYMIFDVPYTGSREPMVGCILYPTFLSFETVQDLARAIRDHAFTEDQFFTIRAFFPYDEIGVRILDPAQLREVTAPAGFRVPRVEWSGESIQYYGETDETNEGNVRRFSLSLCSPETMKAALSAFATPVSAAAHEREADRNADVYYYSANSGSYRETRYKIGPDTFVIELRRQTYSRYPTFTYLSVQQSVRLYKILDDGSGFMVEIYGLTERPSVEWLSQFGLSEPIGE